MADFKKLKVSLGPLGFLADVLSLLQANWGLVVSALIALGAGAWQQAFAFVSSPQVQVVAGVFMWTLWTYIALSVLYRINTGIKTIPVIDYAHSLIVDGVQIAFDKNAVRKDAPALQVGVNIRNVANAPVSMEVHEFRVVLGGRALPDSPMLKLNVPRMGPKGIMSAAFSKEAVKNRAEGNASLVLHYGPVGGPMTRKYVLKMGLTLGLTADQVAIANQITSEEDVPL